MIPAHDNNWKTLDLAPPTPILEGVLNHFSTLPASISIGFLLSVSTKASSETMEVIQDPVLDNGPTMVTKMFVQLVSFTPK